MEPPPDTIYSSEAYDLVLVGAGISGINTAYRLQTELPHARFTILEGRDTIGGTWDLFKYPGVRSDSDLQTYSFTWSPWPHPNTIVEGPLIMEYLRNCVSQHGIDRYIQFKHKVISMNWSSKTQQWTLLVSHGGLLKQLTARFIVLGTGYYDHEDPRKTTIPGIENFKGNILHPQFWPEEFDYTGQRMVIVGSGSTAITLLPNLIKKAAKVTMVQRSPSYVVSVGNHTRGPPWLRFYERVCNLLLFHLFVLYSKYFPSRAREGILKNAVKQLPESVGVDPHFTPKYNPWDQRVCFAPDGDFFKALHGPKAGVVTGVIKQVTNHAVEMEDGQLIEADTIITATGFTMQLGGKIDIRVDGEKKEWRERTVWNGAMLHDVPNMFFVFGYAEAPWTIAADITASVLLRVLKFMESRGARSAVPRLPNDKSFAVRHFFPLLSTYSEEAQERLPKCGNLGPWKPRVSPPIDYLHGRWGDITTGLQFSS
ncbi:FAD/NAD(P)-binding domain-containing protein [Hypoxylon crocopeplum]|nr:FAD/NAD(P)-binding domain-containing protein [Hypoxylon crocopeplum]